MEEERRAACAEKLKRLDEKLQLKPSGGAVETPASSPTPSLPASTSSPGTSQPPSPCVDTEEPPPPPPPLPNPQTGGATLSLSGSNRPRASSSSSSHDSNTGQFKTKPFIIHINEHKRGKSSVCVDLY